VPTENLEISERGAAYPSFIILADTSMNQLCLYTPTHMEASAAY